MLHLLGAVVVLGLAWRHAWEEAHPRLAPPQTIHEAAHRLEAAWWTRRQQALNQVCAARVVRREPDRSWFWAYVEAKQQRQQRGKVLPLRRAR